MKVTWRDIAWLVVIVAIGCAWWLERRDGARAKRMIHELDRTGMTMESLKYNHILD